MWELGLILLVALILLGPRQLTETARVLGRLYREVTKMTNDLRNSVDLDSLTSTTSSSPHYNTPSSQEESDQSSQHDLDMVAPPGERSGPDFYSELLESSKEDEDEIPSDKSDDLEEQKKTEDGAPGSQKKGLDPQEKEES